MSLRGGFVGVRRSFCFREAGPAIGEMMRRDYHVTYTTRFIGMRKGSGNIGEELFETVANPACHPFFVILLSEFFNNQSFAHPGRMGGRGRRLGIGRSLCGVRAWCRLRICRGMRRRLRRR